MLSLFIFFGLFASHCVDGLICYQCNGVSTFDACVMDNGNPVGCAKQYCTIYRQELLDPPGVLVKFLRGCQDTPEYINAEVNTSEHRTFYHACKLDYCNIGEGRLGADSMKPIDEIVDGVIIVPGIGSTASRFFSRFHSALVILVLIHLLIILN